VIIEAQALPGVRQTLDAVVVTVGVGRKVRCVDGADRRPGEDVEQRLAARLGIEHLRNTGDDSHFVRAAHTSPGKHQSRRRPKWAHAPQLCPDFALQVQNVADHPEGFPSASSAATIGETPK
jgi:hypothetical protein